MHYLLIQITFLLCSVLKIYAEDGLVYTGDINKDGIDDQIVSGPMSMFGAQGQNGPFILKLSLGKASKEIRLGGSGYWIVERSNDFIRLWGYGHSSANSGSISYLQIEIKDASTSSGSINISPGDDGTVMGNSIYNSIFDRGFESINCLLVHDYSPPKTDINGVEWGK